MTKAIIKRAFGALGFNISRRNRQFDRYDELYEKYQAFTMIPRDYYGFNLDLCNAYRRLDGDYVECGVWRGGMSGGIAEILGKERRIHLFDSFEGLPPAKEVDGKEAIAWQKDVTSPTYFDNCKAEEAFALSAMKMAGHENFRTYKGWFNATLATYENRPIGILRLDGDWYESVRDCLDHLYPHVVQGGLIVLDDYYAWDGCAKAAHDFLSATHSASRIHKWRDAVAYIVKKE